MKFVHPEILWALSALTIPIIVHLFNFRKFKKVLFPNVSFLKEIHQETKSKSKLKHLLILLARLLAMACIILAFAQPFIPQPGEAEKPGGTAVSIYIDNSISMEAEGKDGRLLELAKNKAIEIAGAFSPTDKFQLLTCDFEGRHQRLVSREEVLELIQEVKLSPVSRKLSEVVLRQRDLLNNSGLDSKRSFLLTDLQKTVTDFNAISNDSTIRFSIVPDQAENTSNVFIDSVWFDSPVRQLNIPEVLHARIVNTGNEKRENVPVQLMSNGLQKSVSSVTIDPESETVLDLTYTNTESGFKKCVLTVDDKSVTEDDPYYFSYDVVEKINVLEVRGNDVTVEAVRTVFSDDPSFNFVSYAENAPDFGSFPLQHLIVLNQLKNISSGLAAEILKFVNNGGSVMILPATDIVQNEYNTFLSSLGLGEIQGVMGKENKEGVVEIVDEESRNRDTAPQPKPTANKVSSVDYDHYIFKNAFEKTIGNVDLPTVKTYYVLNLPVKTTAMSMMTLQSGTPFMVSNNAGSGHAYFCAVSLDAEASNFTSHAFFPATMLRVAEFSQPVHPLAYTLGTEQAIVIRNIVVNNEETFRLADATNGNEFIPEHRNAGGNVEIYVKEALHEAGNYELSRGGELVSVVSFNNDRAESDTHVFSRDDAQAWITESGQSNWGVLDETVESIAATASDMAEGKKYWLSMIVWALIFLAVEILLIKFWR